MDLVHSPTSEPCGLNIGHMHNKDEHQASISLRESLTGPGPWSVPVVNLVVETSAT